MNLFKSVNETINLRNKINQVEMTYVDHIIMDDFNKTDYNPEGILNIFDFSNRKIKNFESNIHFPIEELDGNLNLKIRSGIRNQDQKKLLVMETICRGSLRYKSFDEWFHVAHNELVHFFYDISSNNAKLKWGINL